MERRACVPARGPPAPGRRRTACSACGSRPRRPERQPRRSVRACSSSPGSMLAWPVWNHGPSSHGAAGAAGGRYPGELADQRGGRGPRTLGARASRASASTLQTPRRSEPRRKQALREVGDEDAVTAGRKEPRHREVGRVAAGEQRPVGDRRIDRRVLLGLERSLLNAVLDLATALVDGVRPLAEAEVALARTSAEADTHGVDLGAGAEDADTERDRRPPSQRHLQAAARRVVGRELQHRPPARRAPGGDPRRAPPRPGRPEPDPVPTRLGQQGPAAVADGDRAARAVDVERRRAGRRGRRQDREHSDNRRRDRSPMAEGHAVGTP